MSLNLDVELNAVLKNVLVKREQAKINTLQLIQCIDLTLLEINASLEAIEQLSQLAHTQPIAAVCVFSKHLKMFHSNNKFALATVVNFPEGLDNLEHILDNIMQAAQWGVQEIDYVFPYQYYLAGQKEYALKQAKTVIEHCKQQQLKIKIILETGVFPTHEAIYQLSLILIKAGANFIKTSTGKITQGATLPAVFAILQAIKDSTIESGLKVSGGVRTPQQAFDYAQLAEHVLGKKIDKSWFRIGASTLLYELTKNDSSFI